MSKLKLLPMRLNLFVPTGVALLIGGLNRVVFSVLSHDSEFDAKGRVLKGPAKTALPLVTVAINGNQVRLADCQPAVSR